MALDGARHQAFDGIPFHVGRIGAELERTPEQPRDHVTFFGHRAYRTQSRVSRRVSFGVYRSIGCARGLVGLMCRVREYP
jgi:hypothetical protein